MEYLSALNQEQRSELLEVFDMCYFGDKCDKKAFWKKVWIAGEVEPGEPISQDSFELCLLKAKELLIDRGTRMFTRKPIRINNASNWFQKAR